MSSTNSGIQSAELYQAQLRGERSIYTDLSAFLETNYLRNPFAGFNDRVAADAGVSYLLVRSDNQQLTTEIGLGVLSEGRTDGVSQTFATGRAGIEYKWHLSETADFTNLLAVLDNLQNMADWRLSNTATVTAVVTEIISLKLSFRLDFLNVPVAGKRPTDTATTVALVAKF